MIFLQSMYWKYYIYNTYTYIYIYSWSKVNCSNQTSALQFWFHCSHQGQPHSWQWWDNQRDPHSCRCRLPPPHRFSHRESCSSHPPPHQWWSRIGSHSSPRWDLGTAWCRWGCWRRRPGPRVSISEPELEVISPCRSLGSQEVEEEEVGTVPRWC